MSTHDHRADPPGAPVLSDPALRVAGHARARYSGRTRQWAIDTYGASRENYLSRAACVDAIAAQLEAHPNTVARWIKAEFGSARPLTADDVPARLRAAEAENDRLLRQNRELSERLAAVSPRSISGEVVPS